MPVIPLHILRCISAAYIATATYAIMQNTLPLLEAT
jgi:hypothetical protein